MTFRARLAPFAAVLTLAGAAAPILALPTLAHAEAAADAAVTAAVTKVVNDAQGQGLDYNSMTPELAAAAKAQEAGMASLKQLGAVKTVERVGDATTPYVYKVTYEAGIALTWEITLQADGKINYLNAHQ